MVSQFFMILYFSISFLLLRVKIISLWLPFSFLRRLVLLLLVILRLVDLLELQVIICRHLGFHLQQLLHRLLLLRLLIKFFFVHLLLFVNFLNFLHWIRIELQPRLSTPLVLQLPQLQRLWIIQFISHLRSRRQFF